MKTSHLVFLLLLLILIALPRFNWGTLFPPIDSFIGGKPFDVVQYEETVEYFRGDKSLYSDLESPFSYRPFVPLMASFLPFSPLTSLGLVNLIFLLLACVYLIRILKKLKFEDVLIILGSLLFIVSFPLFYYGTCGYIDASLVGILMIINYYILEEKWIRSFVFFLIGITIKQTIGIIIPVLIIYLSLSNYKFSKKVVISGTFLISYLLIVLIVRTYAPHHVNYLWLPQKKVFGNNIHRIKTYLSFMLTLGIQGIISIYLIVTKKVNVERKLFVTLAAGFVISIMVWGYSVFAAYSDGRQLWISYPFSIPLSLYFFKSILGNKKFRYLNFLNDHSAAG